jgi:60 kDa SS-A/Ro ribonucleoprotein
MSKINIAVHRPTVFTFEGGRAVNVNYEAQLRRSVMSCLLWEDEFYEDGQTIAARIMELSAKVDPETLASIINEARNVHGIRHASLLMLLSLIKSAGEGIGDVVANTMRRADDMTELVALYWKFGNNKHMLPRQLKRGLAKSFNKFNEYQLAKCSLDCCRRISLATSPCFVICATWLKPALI